MAYSTINKPSDYFNTITYTGDDVDGRTITGVGFQSDFSWVKARSSGFSHYIIDAIRYDSGASKYLKLNSASTAADETPSAAGWISELNSDGYVCKNGSSNTNNCNENGVTYVAWNWLGANGTASNTDGSITSTVSANTTAGFSIVSYTGTGATATFGHGLGAVPKMVIIKDRDATKNWTIYHNAMGNDRSIFLNLNNAQSASTDHWQNTTPTSSVVSIGDYSHINTSGNDYIAYCFAEKKGYSKFGSYTGNGSADGTFIYTGFKPAFVMIKKTDTTNDWGITDNKRSPINLTSTILLANDNGVGYSTDSIGYDFLSNGFKMRNTDSIDNTSGGTYIYMAFAERSLVGTNGVPALAR